MQHVVNVSGGAASAVCLFRVLERFGHADVTAVFADTNYEDEDLYRFLDDVERVAEHKIIRLDNGGKTTWDVFNERSMFTGLNRGCCASYHLKKIPLRKFTEARFTPETCTIYMGFSTDETLRQSNNIAALHPWKLEFPLCWQPAPSRCDLMAFLKQKGIEPPRVYGEGYPHNNCGRRCIMAGIKQWIGYMHDDPNGYRECEDQEQVLLNKWAQQGRAVHTFLKDRRGGVYNMLSLKQLREQVEAGERFDTDSWRESTCSCMGIPIATDEQFA